MPYRKWYYIDPNDPDAQRNFDRLRRWQWWDVGLNCLVPALVFVIVCIVLIVQAIR